MGKSDNASPKPYVIVISGSVASGKSTIAAALSKRLENAPVLIFDHYGAFVEWPQDIRRWIKDGSDPQDIHIPKLKEDLLSLLNGKEIIDPLDGKSLKPTQYIILEEPSGRERQEISEYIDVVVYIDTPQDMCVIRLVERAIDMEVWKSEGTFEGEPVEDIVHQLNSVALWINQYQQTRSMYIQVSQVVKEKADIVVNGMDTVNEIIEQIVSELRNSGQVGLRGKAKHKEHRGSKNSPL